MDRIRIGDQLFHKYLGVVSVTGIREDCIVADTKSEGELPFGYYDIGKVLFFSKEHMNKSYKSYLDYYSFCEQENKKIEMEEKEKKEIELIIEKEKEKIRLRKLEEELNMQKELRRQREAVLAKEREEEEREFARWLKHEAYEEAQFLSHTININEIFGLQFIDFEHKFEINKDDRLKIKEILDSRGISHLVHFTRIENLSSILMNGLVPVIIQPTKGIESIKNDGERIDNQLNCTSCSVEFPNYKLFYRFRCQYPNSRWVVILLNTDILFSDNNNAYYCKTNAASVLPKTPNHNELCTPISFESMFREKVYTKENKIINRKELDIGDSFTTDPQAEILISNIISTKYISKVYFNSDLEMKEFTNKNRNKLVDKFELSTNPDLFNHRKDYSFWQKEI